MSAKVGCRSHPDAPMIEDHRAGDMICSECGLVVGDRVIMLAPSGEHSQMTKEEKIDLVLEDQKIHF